MILIDMGMPKGDLAAIPVIIFADGAVRHYFSHVRLGTAVAAPPHMHPVITCGECKNWETDWISPTALEGSHFCPILGLFKQSDWFCADGDKKEV